ncbi:MAG: hypothetical protein CL912_27875 [Deltaproteobacteria bacterium]|mgnify:CR=1 FL=1|nr:hypothetical protein [Deltaproteobacteria bacterium]
MLGHQDLGGEANKRSDAKLGSVGFMVGIEHSPGNMFILLDPEYLKVRGKVWVFIGTEQVVSCDPRIETVIGPGATDGRFSFKDD